MEAPRSQIDLEKDYFLHVGQLVLPHQTGWWAEHWPDGLCSPARKVRGKQNKVCYNQVHSGNTSEHTQVYYTILYYILSKNRLGSLIKYLWYRWDIIFKALFYILSSSTGWAFNIKMFFSRIPLNGRGWRRNTKRKFNIYIL